MEAFRWDAGGELRELIPSLKPPLPAPLSGLAEGDREASVELRSPVLPFKSLQIRSLTDFTWGRAGWGWGTPEIGEGCGDTGDGGT